ncbi:MAG TPA: biopolymer transporter ExbD [Acidobacteriota bacterium]|jgi:biopolymer transport protein ExbD
MKYARRARDPNIPTASMADIAFLLIVYFMLTTVFAATRGLEFGLPEPEDEQKPVKFEEAIYIKVEPGGLLVDGRGRDLGGLSSYITAKMAQNPSKPVIVHGNAATPYRSVMDVLDELRQIERRLQANPKLGPNYHMGVSIPTQAEVAEWERLLGRSLG